MSFKDHFSGHAGQYAAARPTYPQALIDFVAGEAPGRKLAWDAATGNGQAARALAEHFDQVHATDASADQVAAATPADRVRYRCEAAERCSLDDGSAELITVAQAAHWFDLDGFYAEALRVLRPGGVLALWCYGVHGVDAPIDAVTADYYGNTLAAYWPPERRRIESGYATLSFPFERRSTPAFAMAVDWTLDDLIAYLRSWSATQRYLAEHDDPLPALRERLAPIWGGGRRRVKWPITLLCATLD